MRASEDHMLRTAILFLVIGLIAALLGFTPIAGAAYDVAKVIAVLCLIVFLVMLYRSRVGTRQV
jgi:uncharacterized membrane protein YtjA (UPF0391 family)